MFNLHLALIRYDMLTRFAVGLFPTEYTKSAFGYRHCAVLQASP
jgi:hypothetical protein